VAGGGRSGGGADNPQRRRTEKRPFESGAQLDELAVRLGPRYGPPVLFAAATGLRPGEWMALEQRDIDREARVVYVRRPLGNGLRRVYHLRHTFATFALRAGISTFDLSRYIGARLTMIDRHYGHLARDGREHAIRLLDSYANIKAADVQALDARWTPQLPAGLGRLRAG
jgi:integrase